MTGPEHYSEAERLIAMARELPISRDLYVVDQAQGALILADAQVHATLALAAATALDTTGSYAWATVAGTPPPREPDIIFEPPP
jgi:hypothetical protein